MTATSLKTQVPLWRKLLAGAIGVLGAIALADEAGSEPLMLAIPILGPVVAALVVHRASLGPQLVARAIWWSNLGLGALLCVTGSSRDRQIGLVMTLGCGGALLVIGRKGLAEAIERAALIPAAFRSSLLLLMVLALADAQSFGLFALLERDRSGEATTELALAAVAFTVGFVGLYRLAVWGAAVNIATAAALFIATVTGTLRFTRNFGAVVALLTGVQLLVAAPMLVAVVRRKPLPALPQRVRSILAPMAIVTVMVVSISFGLNRFKW